MKINNWHLFVGSILALILGAALAHALLFLGTKFLWRFVLNT